MSPESFDRPGVLFVCMGNICRSPAGEAVMRALLTERGLGSSIEVDSAGTTAYHVGEQPDRRMQAAAAARGYSLSGQSRQVDVDDFDRFSLIVAMDRDNRGDLLALGAATGAQVRLLSEFLPDGAPADVPDPYYGGGRGFDQVLDMIEAACPRILDQLVEP